MVPVPRKKLIEVALPLEAINREAAREKSIRHGHPSTLHLWWARRPLAAARAVIFAQMVDDPDSDPAYRKLDGSLDEDRAGVKRAELLNLIEELVKWENTNNQRVINAARAEIARCIASYKIERGELEKASIVFGAGKGTVHSQGPMPQDGQTTTAWEIVILRAKPEAVSTFLLDHAPPFHDPFAGGGALPLEAQRLGLVAHASDLNPVAVMVNKAMIEIPPRFANQPPVNPASRENQPLFAKSWRGTAGLASDISYYGHWIRDQAEKRIGQIYPKAEITAEMAHGRVDLEPYVGKCLRVIAWIWARTIQSPNPAYSGHHVPLVSSFWLSTRKGKEVYVEPVIGGDTYQFEVRTGQPSERILVASGTRNGRGANFRCILSQSPMSSTYIRSEAQAGRMGARLMAIVCEGDRGRVYLPPIKEHEKIARSVAKEAAPDQEFLQQALGFRIGGYGMTKWADLFTARQLKALTTLSDLVREVRERVLQDALSGGGFSTESLGCDRLAEYANAVSLYLAFALDKQADLGNSLCAWEPIAQCPRHLFGRQAIPMVWDYAEGNPLGGSSGSWIVFVDGIVNTLQKAFQDVSPNAEGVVTQADASVQRISSGKVVSTDPPYYDNIGYADLSDFFYVWLRRSLVSAFPESLATMLAPKSEELVATPARHGGKEAAEEFFMSGMTRALHAVAKQAHREFPISIYYAFKQAEASAAGVASTGWETFLEAVLQAGLSISGTWPMRTENSSRLRGQVSNALASSIILVCRAREVEAPMATRKELVSALRHELPPALRRLQSGNIAPVDLAQASIGPGMAVFSRYSRVLESDGSSMTVRTALQLINQTLDEMLAEQEGEFDAETAWAVAWFEQFGFNDGPFGDAETLSKAKNTAPNALVSAGIVKTGPGKLRLLRAEELPKNWDPIVDVRATGWEATQHLICRLQHEGEQSAAELLRRLGDDYGEKARDLAYRLYSICERKGWAQEALAYNSLVIAWSEICKLSRAVKQIGPTQADLFE